MAKDRNPMESMDNIHISHHRPSPWLRLIAPTLHVHIDPDRAVAAAAHGGPLSFSFTPAALAVGNGIAMEVRTLRVETRHDILR